jgi:hypothetical protein
VAVLGLALRGSVVALDPDVMLALEPVPAGLDPRCVELDDVDVLRLLAV